jgi:hypothetical protein
MVKVTILDPVGAPKLLHVSGSTTNVVHNWRAHHGDFSPTRPDIGDGFVLE